MDTGAKTALIFLSSSEHDHMYCTLNYYRNNLQQYDFLCKFHITADMQKYQAAFN